MSITTSQKSLSCIIPTLLLILTVYFIAPIKGFETRKLDETRAPGSSDPSVKCGGCPCGNPSCYSSPPPPSLPPPPPPPPSPPPPSPPKKPPTVTPYCPPPPSSSWHNPPSGGSGYAYGPPSGSGFVYTTAPPGQLYPVIQNSSSTLNLAATMKITFCLGLLGFLILWT